MTHRTEVLIRSMCRRVKIAHLLIAKVIKRIWPVKRPLATVVKGENLKTKCCYDYEDLTAPKGKQISIFFFHSSRFTQQKYNTFRGKEPFLKYIYPGKG